MKKYSGAVLGGMSYSAVTKAFQGFRKELEDNKELQNEITGLEKKLSTFKA